MNLAQQIERAAQIIREGGVVAFPTETVYGLGANALDPNAIAQIFAIKERPYFDPLIVHICNLSWVERLTINFDKRVEALANRFWPGPLTIVLPKSDLVPDIVTSGLSTVGIRMPSNTIAQEVIRLSGVPIAAPSANKFGRISPTSAKHVAKQLEGVDLIVDGGDSIVGIESTVISLNRDGFIILREGAITAEELEELLPRSTMPNSAPLASPGLLKSHYSPDKPLYIAKSSSLQEINSLSSELNKKGRVAFISFSGITPAGFDKTLFLSHNGNLKEAASNLFRVLHELEEDDSIDAIIAEPVTGVGIAKAIMDKLNKASYRYKSDENKL